MPERRVLSDSNLPHDLEAERAILSALHAEPNLIWDVLSIFGNGKEPHPEFPQKQINAYEKYWYDPTNKVVFSAMVNLAQTGQPFDTVLLTSEIQRIGNPGQVIGSAMLQAMLSDPCSRSENLEHYVRKVRDVYLLRKYAKFFAEITRGTWMGRLSLEEATRKINEMISSLDLSGPDKRLEHVADTVFDQIKGFNQGVPICRVIPTNIPQLDARNGGIYSEGIIMFAARPSVGKTSMLTTITTNLALQGLKVALFSLEMSRSAVCARIVCGLAGINVAGYLKGELYSNDEFHRVCEAHDRLAETNYFIRDGILSVADLRAEALKQKYVHGLDVIAVDYLTLIESDGGSREKDDFRVVIKIMKQLKKISQECEVPILLAAQLNRNISEYEKPSLRDLRDAGEMEADTVFGLFRLEGYDDNPSEADVGIVCLKERNAGANWEETLRYVKYACSFNSF